MLNALSSVLGAWVVKLMATAVNTITVTITTDASSLDEAMSTANVNPGRAYYRDSSGGIVPDSPRITILRAPLVNEQRIICPIDEADSSISTCIAHDRAVKLLYLHLDPEQQRQYANTRSFRVRSQHGHLYRITYGSYYNVFRLNSHNQIIARLCAMPAGGLPIPDNMLFQKLMLESEEDKFWRLANVEDGHGAYLDINTTPPAGWLD